MSAVVVGGRTQIVPQQAERPPLIGEVVVAVVLLVVYDHLRSLTPMRRSQATAHGYRVLDLEGVFRVESGVNGWLASHHALSVLSVDYYQFLHFGAAGAVLVWCYLRRPDVYRVGRNALLVVNTVGLAAFALYPVAPPRLLPGTVFADLVARAGYGTAHGPLPMNAYAAMPSLHLAWAGCVAMTGIAATRNHWARAASVLHPVLTAVVVVGTGNHYVADVVAGAALGCAACATAAWIARRQRRGDEPGALPRSTASGTAPTGAAPLTIVAFHAHPDDETLFTGGTLARAAAEGHRVIVVVATLGEQGLTGGGGESPDLVAVRLHELRRAAAALGCADVRWLGYADSGRLGTSNDPDAFAHAEVAAAAERLARLLDAVGADVLTSYDDHGGYGHPDHVAVHLVGRRAAEMAGTPLLLEATVDRRAARWAARILRPVPGLADELRPRVVARSFADPATITHRIDVGPYLDAKRAAMTAHASQTTGGRGLRSLALYLRLPPPLFRLVFGHEWYVEPGRAPGRRPLDEPFATLRPRAEAMPTAPNHARQRQGRAGPMTRTCLAGPYRHLLHLEPWPRSEAEAPSRSARTHRASSGGTSPRHLQPFSRGEQHEQHARSILGWRRSAMTTVSQLVERYGDVVAVDDPSLEVAPLGMSRRLGVFLLWIIGPLVLAAAVARHRDA
ncbi:MAG: phosphatase PAP2 family protein [Acidimicrobiales bacterium]